MVMTSAQFSDLVEGPTKKIFDGAFKRFPAEWSVIFDSEAGKKARFQDKTILYGLGVAPEKPEGTVLQSDQGGISYRIRGTFKAFGLMVGVTKEMRDDAEGVQVASWLARETAKALNETKEIVHADFFNRAVTAGFTIGGGQTMLSASHPYPLGGTFSNLLAAADLSEASLESLCIMVDTVKDDRAQPMWIKPVRLIVSPHNRFNATRILRSTLQSGTANNDVNAIRSTGILPTEPFVLHRLTVNPAYFIQTDAPNGFMHYTRGGVERGMETDFTTDNAWWKVYERYLAQVEGPRCVFGSMGI